MLLEIFFILNLKDETFHCFLFILPTYVIVLFVIPLQSEVVLITGPVKNCSEARAALEKRVQQLEAEKEDRVGVTHA